MKKKTLSRARLIKRMAAGALALPAAPAMFAPSAGAAAPPDGEEPRFVPGEILVTFEYEEKFEPAQKVLTASEPDVVALIKDLASAIKASGLLSQPFTQSAQTMPGPLTLRFHLVPASGLTASTCVLAAVAQINARPWTRFAVKVVGAMPNWIVTCAAAGWHGGPGDPPHAAITAKKLHVPPALASGNGAGTIVVVLDTWPLHGRSRLAAEYPTSPPATVHPLPYASYPSPSTTRICTPYPALVNHGLFVAGLILSAAPKAQVHVVPVLGPDGYGTTHTVLQGLQICQALAKGGSPVVVNLSLFALIPPDDVSGGLDPYLTSYPNTLAFNPVGQAKQSREQPKQTDSTRWHLGLRQTLSALKDVGIVAAAAAGNDAQYFVFHPQPRIPADYADEGLLLCVTAANSGTTAQLASYANGVDQLAANYSIAVWGGDATSKRVTAWCKDMVPPYNQTVIGLSTGAYLYWIGTSFATAIVSGLAAKVLSTTPSTPASARLPFVNNTLRGASTQMVNSYPLLNNAYIPFVDVKQV
jgi:subtilisin family serine protease